MTFKPIGADDATGILPDIVQAQIEGLIENVNARVPAGNIHALPTPAGDPVIDNANLAAAIVAAGARGVILAGVGEYHIDSHHVIPSGVDLRGQGGGSTSKTGATTFKCVHADAKIEIAGGGGLSGGFEIDGNSIATTPFRRSGGVGANARTFHNITVRANAISGTNSNDLAEFYGAQNDLFFQCGFADADRDLAHFDQGFGGTMFLRCQWRSAGRYHHFYDDAVAGGPYLVPSDIKHIGGICEGTSGISIVKAEAAGYVYYDKHPIYSVDGCSGPMVHIAHGTFSLHDQWMQSTPATLLAGTIGVQVQNSASVTISGQTSALNLETVLNVDSSITAFLYDSSTILPINCTNVATATGGAFISQIGQVRGTSLSFFNPSTTDFVMFNLNAARTAQRFGIRSNGRLEWFPGTNFTRDVAIGRRAAGAVGVEQGTQQLFCLDPGTTAQRPAAAAALAGALYPNTTTGWLEWCDGSTWVTTNQPAATETAAGIVELATVAEALTGTDTTRAITAAGLNAVRDALLTDAETLTNKRITKRVVSTASAGATWTIDGDATDIGVLTAQAANLTIAAPTGTPTTGQTILIRIKDNGTARTLTWNAIFNAIGVTLPATTVLGKYLYVLVIWNEQSSEWDVLAVGQEA